MGRNDDARSAVPPPEAGADSPEPRARRRLLLTLAAALLVVAVIVAVQLVGILYGLVFPPDAPLPPDVLLIDHDNIAYGVDEWVYGTATQACAVVAYFQSEGGECVITPGQCGVPGNVPPGQSTQNVATCRAVIGFSIFTMAWEATIAGGYRSELQTRFTLRREVFWIGGPSASLTGLFPRP